LYLAMTSDYEYKASKFADGLEHAQQAIKLNGKPGPYYVLAAMNAYAQQDFDKTREYAEIVVKGGPSTYGQGPCKDAGILQSLVVKKTYTIFWNLDPKKGRLVAGSFPVAMPKGDLPYQSVSYEIEGARSHRL